MVLLRVLTFRSAEAVQAPPPGEVHLRRVPGVLEPEEVLGQPPVVQGNLRTAQELDEGPQALGPELLGLRQGHTVHPVDGRLVEATGGVCSCTTPGDGTDGLTQAYAAPVHGLALGLLVDRVCGERREDRELAAGGGRQRRPAGTLQLLRQLVEDDRPRPRVGGTRRADAAPQLGQLPPDLTGPRTVLEVAGLQPLHAPGHVGPDRLARAPSMVGLSLVVTLIMHRRSPRSRLTAGSSRGRGRPCRAAGGTRSRPGRRRDAGSCRSGP